MVGPKAPAQWPKGASAAQIMCLPTFMSCGRGRYRSPPLSNRRPLLSVCLRQGGVLHAIQMAKAETAVYGGVQAAFSSNKALAKAVAASEFPSGGVRLPINFHGEYKGSRGTEDTDGNNSSRNSCSQGMPAAAHQRRRQCLATSGSTTACLPHARAHACLDYAWLPLTAATPFLLPALCSDTLHGPRARLP